MLWFIQQFRCRRRVVSLLMAQPGALGYTTVFLSTQVQNLPASTLSYNQHPPTGEITLENEYLAVNIDKNGMILSLKDKKQSGEPTVVSNGNDLAFYQDRGDIFRFGNESPTYKSATLAEVQVHYTEPQFGIARARASPVACSDERDGKQFGLQLLSALYP